MKALGLVLSDKKIFKKFIWKTNFWPVTYLCNQSEELKKIGIISVEFGQIPISSSSEEVV